MEIADEWQVFEDVHDGSPLIARFNVGARLLVKDPRYPIQIGVAVPFREPDANGLPGPADVKALIDFEELLAHRPEAVFVGVITTAGMREFVLYTGSSDWIEGFHRVLEAALPTHEVQVMAQTDPAWSVYLQFAPT
jgi:hypothetical protein